MNSSEHRPATSRETWALTFASTFPTVLTWVYFVWLAETSAGLQQGVYSVGKVIQFGFPLAWLLLTERWRPSKPNWTSAGVLVGLSAGMMIAASALGLYHGWWKPAGLFNATGEVARKKVEGMGITNVGQFAALGLFYSIGHSLLEEYYWRWFVFGRLKHLVRPLTAVAISSMGFMAHHVIVLGLYFGYDHWMTYFFSLSVAVGGVIWSLLYQKSNSLLGPWLSHCLVDAAIFLIGYDLLRSLWTSA